MCNYSSLHKNIHALSNFNIDFAIVCNVSEFILINNILRCDVEVKLHIFVTVHWCADIKVWYVYTQKYGVRCWDGVFDKGFSCCDICCGSFNFTRLVSYIFSKSDSCSAGFRFMWFYVTDYSSICHFPIMWDLWFWNEIFYIWSINSVAHTLSKSYYFFGEIFVLDYFIIPFD